MKKVVLRSVILAVIISAGIAMIVWYMSMRRKIPEHARVIPKDAFAVLTMNLRELALDRAGNEHLYPDLQDQGIMENELAPLTRALQANGSETGVVESADLLAFTYHSGDAGYFGVSIALNDSATFGNLIRTHLSAEYNIVPWSTDGIPLLRFDTTAAVIGWTEDAALFLYPLGHHGVAFVSTQCAALLKQDKANSVLDDDNFCEHQMKPFDAALWIQTRPFLNFTRGGAQLVQLASDVEYFNFFSEFDEGEIRVRSEWHLADDVVKDVYEETPFPCESEKMVGFVRTHIDVSNDTMLPYYADAYPLTELPLNDEECVELLPSLTGDCINLVHDTISYWEKNTRFVFDSNFNRLAIVDSTLRSKSTYSISFAVADYAKANEVLTKIMTRDSIPLTNRGWIYEEGGIEKRLILTEELLTLTTSPEVDGRSHPIPQEQSGFLMWYDLAEFFGQQSAVSVQLFFPVFEKAYAELATHCVSFSNTLPVQSGDVRRSEIILTFRNEEVNGLIQAEEILRRIYFTK